MTSRYVTLKTRNVAADTYLNVLTGGADVLSPNRIERVLERVMLNRRPRLSDESGMSLVEILVAVFILAVAVIAIASTAAASLQSVRESRERQDATQFASTVIEEVRALPFSDIALDDTTVSETEFEDEEILAAPGGVVPHVRTDGNQTATTYITIIDTVAAPVALGEELRVTVLVTWGDVDGQHTVRQETRIAEATRGLPVPSFTVSPTSEGGNGVPGETICMDHTLRNLGEQDAYSWQLWATNSSTGALEPADYKSRTVNEPDGSGGTQSVTREGYKVKTSSDGAHWFGWALMAIPASNSTFQPMSDDTADLRPDSPSTVLALGDARIRFCYTALSQAGVIEATDDATTLTPRIYSAFDETVNTETLGNELSNTINVVSANTNLYLREVGGTTKTMTIDAPDNTDETLDYDGDGTPGLHVDGTFDPTSWAANVSALGFSSLPRDLSNPSVTFHVRTDDDEADQDLTFDVRLLRQSGGDPIEVLGSQSVPVSSVTTAWQPVAVALTLPSPVSVDGDDTLFVEIGCDEANSDDDCHVHYDVTTLDSRFSGDFQ